MRMNLRKDKLESAGAQICDENKGSTFTTRITKNNNKTKRRACMVGDTIIPDEKESAKVIKVDENRRAVIRKLHF